jgi:AbiV family abortive infection protein
MARHLDSYRGRLTARQIATGINAARRNARRLAEDSQLLFDAKRYPTAASLAILSIEEAGKESILRQIALTNEDKELKASWKDFRSHTKKNAMWLLPQLVSKGARRLDDFRELFDEEADHTFILDMIKQVSFYTDCLGKAHWSEPPDVIDKDLARVLLHVAKVLVKDREITTKEVELWTKHMGPVRDRPYVEQKKALLNWYADLQEFGLTDERHNVVDLVVWLGLANDREADFFADDLPSGGSV